MAGSPKPIVAGDRVHRPLFDHQVTDEDWQKAKDELNETPETRQRCLKQLKQMLADQNEFVPQTDDNYLLQFLRTRKFDGDRAYKLLKEHYKIQARHPEFFTDPSKLKHVYDSDIHNYLPYRDHHGRAIFLCRISNWDTFKVPYHNFIGSSIPLTKYCLDNPVTQINGFVTIWDFKGFGLGHFARFANPKNAWILKNMIQDSFPGRFKAAYCVNCHPLVNKCYNILKIFFKDKYIKRIFFFGSNWSDLHEHLDPSILPKDYGGQQEKMTSNLIVDRILRNEKDKDVVKAVNAEFGAI